MNEFAHTLEVTRLVHARLLEWVREILIRAGMDSVQVKGRFSEEDAAGPTMTVFPYQMGAWPKMVETSSDILLFGKPPDSEGVVPGAWTKVAQLLTECMLDTYPVDKARGSRPARVRPVTPLTDLPAPLKAWYEAQYDDGSTNNWTVVGRRDTVSGRLPSLSWRRPLMIRQLFLVLANDTDAPSGLHAGLPFGLSALAVVLLGIQVEKTLAVEVPAMPCDPALLNYIDAMAQSIGDERGEELHRLLDVLRSPFNNNIALLPFPDLPSDDTAEVMKALNKTLQPVVHLGIQLGVGAGPVFAPSVSPVFSTKRMTDEEDGGVGDGKPRRRRP